MVFSNMLLNLTLKKEVYGRRYHSNGHSLAWAISANVGVCLCSQVTFWRGGTNGQWKLFFFLLARISMTRFCYFGTSVKLLQLPWHHFLDFTIQPSWIFTPGPFVSLLIYRTSLFSTTPPLISTPSFLLFSFLCSHANWLLHPAASSGLWNFVFIFSLPRRNSCQQPLSGFFMRNCRKELLAFWPPAMSHPHRRLRHRRRRFSRSSTFAVAFPLANDDSIPSGFSPPLSRLAKDLFLKSRPLVSFPRLPLYLYLKLNFKIVSSFSNSRDL